jgi:hypothetical protein
VSDPLQTLLGLGAIPPVAFPPDSRYYGFSTLQQTLPDGTTVSYLARRYVPQPGAENYAVVAQHTVQQEDRPDLIAARYLGDPLLAWAICDANGVVNPDDLVATPGAVIAITMPQGIPGGTSA